MRCLPASSTLVAVRSEAAPMLESTAPTLARLLVSTSLPLVHVLLAMVALHSSTFATFGTTGPTVLSFMVMFLVSVVVEV
jgi:hypothetical protein